MHARKLIHFYTLYTHKKLTLTTLYDGPETQVTCRTDAMDHKDKVVYLFWFTLGKKMSQKLSTVGNTLKRGLWWAYILMYFLLVQPHTYHRVFPQRYCPLLSWQFVAWSAPRVRTPTHPAILLADTASSAEREVEKWKRRCLAEVPNWITICAKKPWCCFVVYLITGY